MNVLCNKCQKQYQISDYLVTHQTLIVRCSNCNNVFKIYPEIPLSQNEALTETINLPFSVEYVEKIKDIMVIRFPGDSVDASNSEDYKHDLLPFIHAYKKIIFDFAQIKKIDSCGCGLLFFCVKKAEEKNTKIVLCNVSDTISSLFRLTRLNIFFSILESEEKAIHSFQF